MSTAVAHAEREHALLAASAAHRWLVCTPSARLEDTLPDNESDSAKKGELAHEIAELKLRRYFVEPMGPRAFNNRLKKFKEHPLYEEEMLRHTDTYLEYVQGIVHGFTAPPYIAIERKLVFDQWAPEGFGTGDCIIIGGNKLILHDFKYGKGVPVEAEDNPQLRLYALAAYDTYRILYPIEEVHMAIVQPRLDRIREVSMTISDLLAWGESIKPIAQKAFAGEGDFVPGEHCGFCRAKATCRARADKYGALLEEYKLMRPPLISNEEVGAILEKAQGVAAWAKALQEYALKETLSGNNIPGWKAVHGRGSREYVDIDTAFAHLKANGIDEAVLYERKPLTVAALEEKILKAADYKKLLEEPGHIIKQPGKPALVSLSDKREAITRQTAADDFNTNNGGNEE